MVPLVGEARADRAVGEHRPHRQLDPQHVLEASARLEEAERAQAGAGAHRRARCAVSPRLRTIASACVGKRGIVERAEPAGDERAGARREAVVGVVEAVDLGGARVDRGDRILEAGVVVVGDADALHQRGAGEQPARASPAASKRAERAAQLGPAGADVAVGEREALAQQPPRRLRARRRRRRHFASGGDGAARHGQP